jgi:DNA-binding MarR family transcriptional regulator
VRLEEEIKATVAFEDERSKAMVNLVYTYNVLVATTMRVLKDFNLNEHHYNVLKILADQMPNAISVGEISARRFDRRGDLTRLLDKLCAMGLVHRQPNPVNRRVVDVAISELGVRQLRNIDARLEVNANVKQNLTEAEAAQLNGLLDRLRG